MKLIGLGRNSVEPEAGITIILLSGENLPSEFDGDLTKTVHKALGAEPLVRIFPVLSVRQCTPENQGIGK